MTRLSAFMDDGIYIRVMNMVTGESNGFGPAVDTGNFKSELPQAGDTRWPWVKIKDGFIVSAVCNGLEWPSE